jgi:hypothetical protein
MIGYALDLKLDTEIFPVSEENTVKSYDMVIIIRYVFYFIVLGL